jgi:hypothetical protein
MRTPEIEYPAGWAAHDSSARLFLPVPGHDCHTVSWSDVFHFFVIVQS